ncbi:DUF4249 domain-containing protein [Bacteroidia bacterium]|jgi:hypothetical protein|nr:DUF4249 domain-containing protein [Bacteroidia bacterium]
MRKRRLFFATVIFLGLITSCTKELPLGEVNSQIRLTVNMLGDNLQSPSVSVTLSSPINGTDSFPPVPNAKAYIIDGTDTAKLEYDIFFKTYSSGTFKLQPSTDYDLVVDVPGYPTATSKLSMPQIIDLNGTVFKDSIGIDNQGFPVGGVDIVLKDPGAIRNFYRLTFFTWSTSLSEWEEASLDFVDTDIANAAQRNQNGNVLLKDDLFNGSTQVIRLYAPFGFSGQNPKFKIIVDNLESNYYYYLQSIENYQPSGGIFQEPAQILTNINNGVGIFAGSTQTEFIIN